MSAFVYTIRCQWEKIALFGVCCKKKKAWVLYCCIVRETKTLHAVLLEENNQQGSCNSTSCLVLLLFSTFSFLLVYSVLFCSVLFCSVTHPEMFSVVWTGDTLIHNAHSHNTRGSVLRNVHAWVNQQEVSKRIRNFWISAANPDKSFGSCLCHSGESPNTAHACYLPWPPALWMGEHTTHSLRAPGQTGWHQGVFSVICKLLEKTGAFSVQHEVLIIIFHRFWAIACCLNSGMLEYTLRWHSG